MFAFQCYVVVSPLLTRKEMEKNMLCMRSKVRSQRNIFKETCQFCFVTNFRLVLFAYGEERSMSKSRSRANFDGDMEDSDYCLATTVLLGQKQRAASWCVSSGRGSISNHATLRINLLSRSHHVVANNG